MEFLIVLLVSIAAVAALRNPLKKYPVAFYILAIAVSVVFIASDFFGLPRSVWSTLFLLLQKCMLGLSLFTIVMFIGVFEKNSKVKRYLRPIRAELSIIAWIFSMSHMVIYLSSYLPRLGSFASTSVYISFTLAIVLFLLLVVLGVTSFNVVKAKMSAITWKKVQKLAYVFFVIVYVHLLFMLMPAALVGGAAAQISVGVYSVIFISYIVLRVRRALVDKSAQE